METFKDRLITERDELLEKITKLQALLMSNRFNHLGQTQQVLLHVQHRAMCTYYECLKQRIENL